MVFGVSYAFTEEVFSLNFFCSSQEEHTITTPKDTWEIPRRVEIWCSGHRPRENPIILAILGNARAMCQSRQDGSLGQGRPLSSWKYSVVYDLHKAVSSGK
jgi:hypothetical protein